MKTRLMLLGFLSFLVLFINSNAQMPGFLSLDCGGKENSTDALGLVWTSDNQLTYGEAANVSVVNETRQQYMTVRYFPADNRKYCYTLNIKTRTRYLVRASFLYGNFDKNNVYPKFDISLGASPWSTIVISDASTIETREAIILARAPTIAVCLSNATTGNPFISTVELRPFNGSVYYTDLENQFFMSVSARINFGAVSEDPIRYPDDPFDRIWLSDSLKKANYLVDVAPGTQKVSTKRPIDINRKDRPPEKVMQTAVVGTTGSLNYRINLEGFPGMGWAVSYLAEIEELSQNESRAFKLVIPGMSELSTPTVNITENAGGKYRLYEPGFINLTLPYILNFKFMQSKGSLKGPLLNAMEINKYMEINDGSLDAVAISGLVSHYALADWAGEGGDPCLPVPWSWLQCNSDRQPRITSIFLSMKNLTGSIPLEITNFPALVDLRLDGNSFTGPIPDFTRCPNLKIIHLENNQLTGELPSSLSHLQDLTELYLQNNMLSGTVPSDLLDRSLILRYSGNVNLKEGRTRKNHTIIILGSTVGAAILLLVTIASCLFIRQGKKKSSKDDELAIAVPAKKPVSSLKNDTATETAHCFPLSEIEDATRNFEKKIGSGGFGVVFYGKLKNGKEIAVKVLTNNSYQGRKEFTNEVTLLSRIHHRNLVQFLGYCQEESKSMELRNILIYEFMHKGTLKEHLYGPLTREGSISWMKRLEIAEDSAKGIEYLHTGCVPTIIHRDLKSSNILLDKHMRAKVSDFGLSRLEVDGGNPVSSVVRGTVGYLDPEYYISQQLTEKSDIYSFGVILLELISGKEAISNEFGDNIRNIVQWAKSHIQSGDIQRIIDPLLGNDYNLQSVWKIAEKAMMCVQPQGSTRPSMSDVLKEIQNALSIERGAEAAREGNSDEMSSLHSSINVGMGSTDFGVYEPHVLFDEGLAQPSAR